MALTFIADEVMVWLGSSRGAENLGPVPCNSHFGSTEVTSMIFKRVSPGTVIPPS